MGPTTPFASVVRKANRSAFTSPSLTFRVDVQLVQIPAKNRRGRSSPAANQTGTFRPSAVVSYSLKLVKGTRQRCSTPSHRRQCGEVTFRTLVTPGSVLRPFRAKAGEGRPQRIMASSRVPSSAVRTTGAGVSGKTARRAGRLPVVSRIALASWRMASWPLVREYRLHTADHLIVP